MVTGHKPSSKIISSPELICIYCPRLSLPFLPWSPFPSLYLSAASFLPISKDSKNSKGSSAHGSQEHKDERLWENAFLDRIFSTINCKLTSLNKVQLQWNKNENKLYLSNTESQKDLGGKGHRTNSKAGSSSSRPYPVEFWKHRPCMPLVTNVPIDIIHALSMTDILHPTLQILPWKHHGENNHCAPKLIQTEGQQWA